MQNKKAATIIYEEERKSFLHAIEAYKQQLAEYREELAVERARNKELRLAIQRYFLKVEED